MAHLSVGAMRFLGPNFIEQITVRDVYEPLSGVIDEGWTVDDGAALLIALRDSYFGERSRFATITAYEVAVNGRAIPDTDLGEADEERVRHLLRRGTAFAWQALHKAREDLPKRQLVAVVSAGATLIDPSVYTGNVTFYAGKIEAGIEASLCRDEDIVVMLESRECVETLPAEFRPTSNNSPNVES